MEHFGEGPSMGLSPHGPFTAAHTPQTSPLEYTTYTSQFAPEVDPLMSDHTSTHHGHILDPLVTTPYRCFSYSWLSASINVEDIAFGALVGERSGLVKSEESRRHALGDDLERESQPENPFLTLYLHSLRQGVWKDAIRFELVSDGSTDKPGVPDMQIKCLHGSFVIDPLTGKEANFSLSSRIDVEKLSLRAICCNRYTRLLEIYKELVKNGRSIELQVMLFFKGHADEPDADYKKLFEFKTDEEQVIEGLDIAVMTMKKGEIALLTVAPEYAFGSSESHQNRRGSSKLICYVLQWMSEVDAALIVTRRAPHTKGLGLENVRRLGK
ncbi:Mediator of RNA polymerase II transcription subunit 14 [Camellia lanceoleosa]|uniref:Mediator of RNA polymerase II transcription subunit 14 n=1 Tax=Camellia lanceoleosa TaxID=1840588 RepID=A0ACC0I284_9ERIC|nr:Mediator of RNA polymerase II transcription subunit 14 [Camellia lanceoleosa]